MTATKRRFAAASLATLMPLAAISIATAAPGVAETTCSGGQVSFNGSCVDQCKSSQVRNSATGECRDPAGGRAGEGRDPGRRQADPEQLGGAWQMANNIGAIPEASRAVGMTMNIVDTAVDIPVAASVRSRRPRAHLGVPAGRRRHRPSPSFGAAPRRCPGLLGGRRYRPGRPGAALPADRAAQAAEDRASPAPPKIGFPKIGMPRIGPPKLGASGICGPKLLFFTPCL